MSTWISKSIVAVGLALGLTGCIEVPGTASVAEPLTRANLSRGSVTLAVPQGYCIDRRTVQARGVEGFALIARCDALGAEGWYRAQHLVLITVSTAPLRDPSFVPTPETVARSAMPAEILERRTRDGLAVALVRGEKPESEGLSMVHWRAAFALNGHLAALSLFAPEGSTALRQNGSILLAEIAAATRAASAALEASKAPDRQGTKTTDLKNRSFSAITGLSD